VYAKVWNAWLWLRSTADLPTDATERRKRLQNELASYYGGWAYDVQVMLLEAIPPGPIEGHTTKLNEKGQPMSRNRCPVAMSLEGTGFHAVFVRFVPTDGKPRPWPALAKVFGSLSTMRGGCPTGALWLLDRVLTTSDVEVPEAPEGFLAKLEKGTLSGREAIPGVSDVIKALIVAGVVYVIVQIAVTARAFAPRGD
jgi:hypothetical protein